MELAAEKPFKKNEAEEVVKLISEGFDRRSVEELKALLDHADMRGEDAGSVCPDSSRRWLSQRKEP